LFPESYNTSLRRGTLVTLLQILVLNVIERLSKIINKEQSNNILQQRFSDKPHYRLLIVIANCESRKIRFTAINKSVLFVLKYVPI
jgi:hypothetical protein